MGSRWVNEWTVENRAILSPSCLFAWLRNLEPFGKFAALRRVLFPCSDVKR